MRRNKVFGRLLSIVLAATLALTPATTVMAASAEDAGLYGSSVEDGDDGSAGEASSSASAEASDEDEDEDAAGKGSGNEDDRKSGDESEKDSDDKNSDDASKEATETPEDDDEESSDAASSSDSSEEAASEASSDSAAEASSEGIIEETKSRKALVGNAPAAFPQSAVVSGAPVVMGTNVKGQLYTWTAGDTEHLGLYVYNENGAGINVSFKASSALGDNYKNITDLAFDDSIEIIGGSVFSGCSAVATVAFPQKLTTIGGSAFSGCTSLSEITIPKGVTSNNRDIFDGCTKLTIVNFEPGMTKIPEKILYNYSGNSHVTTVNIPSSVTVIGEYAFTNQGALKNVVFEGTSLKEVHSCAFQNTGIEGINLASGVTYIGGSAFSGCQNLGSITLPEKLTTIGGSAFASCTSLSEITIPKGVTSNNRDIFDGCTKLTTVNFEPGMTKIPEKILYNYSGNSHVTTVNIPSSVTVIGEYAFHGLKYLESIDLPASVKTIKSNAFAGCGLETVYYGGTEESRKKISIEKGNDPLTNARWICLKGVTELTLSKTYEVIYRNDSTAGKEITFTATVLPADASHMEVRASYKNETGEAVKNVIAGDPDENVSTIKVTLTGKTGLSVVTVTSRDGNCSATYTVEVREQEKARTPVFYLNGIRVPDGAEREMTADDRLTVSGLTSEAQTFYSLDADTFEVAVVYDETNETYKLAPEVTNVFVFPADALIGGKDITTSRTIYAASYKKDFKPSAVSSITVNYTPADAWGEVAEEDQEAELPEEKIWIPESVLANDTLVYTGSKITLPGIRVYYGTKLLDSKTDYTLTYTNNINAASKDDANAPKVKVTLKGNYNSISEEFKFTIKPAEFTANQASVTNVVLTESRDKATNELKVLTADPKLKVSGKVLKLGTDYELTIYNAGTDTVVDALRQEGVYDIKATGKGNYSGEAVFRDAVQVVGTHSVKLTTLNVSKPENKTIAFGWDVSDQGFFEQDITVTFRGQNFVVPEDAYDVLIPTIEGAGKYTATVVGNGSSFEKDGENYYIIGSKALTFTVTGSVALKDVTIDMPTTEKEYDPDNNRISDYRLEYEEENYRLIEGKDFTVAFKNDKKAGTATIIYTGKGAFTGTVKKTYKITKKDISEVVASNANGAVWDDDAESYCYTKGGVKPEVKLSGIPSSGYSVSYSNNAKMADYMEGEKKNPAITIKGKGNYTGTKVLHFSIDSADISDLDMTVKDLVASGSPKKYAQTPVILDINGKKLAAGTDFEKTCKYTYVNDVVVKQKVGKNIKSVSKVAGALVEDKDIIPAETQIEMTVTGKGNYTGTISETYTIAGAKISALKFEIKYEEGKSSFTYTGKAIRPGKDNIVVKAKQNGRWVQLNNGGEYYDIVSYKNNVNKGTATITIKGKNGYAGTASVTFKITAR